MLHYISRRNTSRANIAEFRGLNHYNERTDKRIRLSFKNQIIDTGLEKFGALIGDNSRIGANAVLSPGTILKKDSVVKRLELIEQLKGN